jgi:hypothetical protein
MRTRAARTLSGRTLLIKKRTVPFPARAGLNEYVVAAAFDALVTKIAMQARAKLEARPRVRLRRFRAMTKDLGPARRVD